MGGDKVVVALYRNKLEGGFCVGPPLLHISPIYGVVIVAIKSNDRNIKWWGGMVAVLDGHHYVIYPHGSYPIEEPLILLHFFQSSKVALFKDLFHQAVCDRQLSTKYHLMTKCFAPSN